MERRNRARSTAASQAPPPPQSLLRRREDPGNKGEERDAILDALDSAQDTIEKGYAKIRGGAQQESRSSTDTTAVPAIENSYADSSTAALIQASTTAETSVVQEPLSSSEDQFVRALVPDGDVLKFFARVGFASGKGKGTTKLKFEQVIIVVTRFRWFVVASDMLGRRKIKKQAHVFETDVIAEGGTPGDVRIIFTDGDQPNSWLVLRGPMARKVAVSIYSSWRRVSDHIIDVPGHKFFLKVTLPGVINDDPVPKDFYKLYEAVSALYGTPVCDAFSRFYRQHVGTKVLDLAWCPGIEPGSSTVRLQLPALFDSLGLNAQLHSLVCRNILAPAGLSVAGVVQHSMTLTKLVCTDIDGIIDWVALGSALKTNKSHKLHILDFSGNQLSERDGNALVTAFKSFSHGVSVLRLSRCSLRTKQIVSLFDGFRSAQAVSIPMLELDLSHNAFGEEGSRAMSRWLHFIGASSQLRRLCVASSHVEVGQLVSAGLGLLPHLQLLDVSSNVLDDAGVQVLSVILERTMSITMLRAGDCSKMSHEGMRTLFTVMQRNSALSQCSIDFSGTSPGETVADIPLYELGDRKISINALDISRCKLGAPTVIKMIRVIKQVSLGLESLTIGGNCDVGVDPSGCQDVIDEIVTFLSASPAITRFSVKGTSAGRLGATLYKLFDYFQMDTNVLEFDFSGNNCGDAAFLHFTEALHMNSTLRKFGIDKNRLTFNSFLSLRESLVANGVAHKLMEEPQHDIAYASSLMPSQRQRMLADIMRECRERLNFNDARHRIFDARNGSSDVKPPNGAPAWWPEGADEDKVDPGSDFPPLFDADAPVASGAVDQGMNYGTVNVGYGSATGTVTRPGLEQVDNSAGGLAPGEITMRELQFGNEIGRGSFGVVFSGTWRGGKVAIKRLLMPAQHLAPQQVQAFQAEAALMAQLRPHSNVVQFQGFTLAPQLCIVTEFLQNRSLRELLDAGRPIEQRQVSLGIAAGLLHLHAERLTHGDLAARNVLIGDSDSVVKLADFGQARTIVEESASDEYARSNANIDGPLKWLAPESIKDKLFVPKSDIWSFGVVMFEIASRKLPYETMTPLQAAIKVSAEQLKPEPPTGCSDGLAETMQMCCQFDMEDRPTTQQLFDFLDQSAESSWTAK